MVLLTTNSHLLSNLKLATTDVWSQVLSNELVQSKEVTSAGFDFINLDNLDRNDVHLLNVTYYIVGWCCSPTALSCPI